MKTFWQAMQLCKLAQTDWLLPELVEVWLPIAIIRIVSDVLTDNEWWANSRSALKTVIGNTGCSHTRPAVLGLCDLKLNFDFISIMAKKCFAFCSNRNRYWHCWNGTATIQQCPFSLLYNDALHACDWPDNVSDCQKHPICKDTPNGPVPIEKSCVRYWLCVGGYPRLQRCPAGLAVNPGTLKCELATTVTGW